MEGNTHRWIKNHGRKLYVFTGVKTKNSKGDPPIPSEFWKVLIDEFSVNSKHPSIVIYGENDNNAILKWSTLYDYWGAKASKLVDVDIVDINPHIDILKSSFSDLF